MLNTENAKNIHISNDHTVVDGKFHFCTLCVDVSKCQYIKLFKYKLFNPERIYTNLFDYSVMKFIPYVCEDEYNYNALIEVQKITELTMSSVHRIHKQLHGELFRVVNIDKVDKKYLENRISSIQKIKTFKNLKISLYDTITKMFVYGKSNNEYYFNGKNIVEFRTGDGSDSRYLLTTDLLEVYNSDKLLNSYNNVINDINNGIINSFKVNFINGVPGCGKTTRIIRDYVNDQKTVIASATREGAVDIRKRIAKKFGLEPNDKNLSKYIRTVDSLIINPNVQCVNLMVDEALMKHPGEIYALCNLLNISNVELIGDICQIPYVNRVADFGAHFILYPYTISERLYTSYRCPGDVMSAINGFYDQKTNSESSVKNKTVTVQRIFSAQGFVNVVPKDFKILCFKQSEKTELKTLIKDRVINTIHEYQGQQAKNVCVVRLSSKPAEEIYLRDAYALVAISRHTHKFTYYTMCPSDSLVKMCKRAIASKGGFLYTESRPDGFIQEKINAATVFKNITDQVDFETDTKWFKKLTIFQKFAATIESGRGYRALDINIKDTDETTWKLLNHYYTDSHHLPKIEISNYAEHLQMNFDRILPSNGCRNRDLDFLLCAKSPLQLSIDNMNLRNGYSRSPDMFKNREKFLKPVLFTSCPQARVETLQEMLLAIQKRNSNVPEMQELISDPELPKRLFTNFCNTYFDETKLNVVHEYTSHPCGASVHQVPRWWFASNFTDTMYMNNFYTLDFTQMSWNKYDYSIKPTPKPTQTIDASREHGALQTISAHKKFINSVFCPIIKEFKTRITSVFKNNVLIFGDMSNFDLVTHLNRILNPAHIRKLLKKKQLVSKELDISKYDKSQGVELLIFVCMLMRLMGVDEDIIDYYFNMELICVLNCPKLGLRFMINLQMKSGTAPTFIFNTLKCMAISACAYPLDDALIALFAGDDSYYLFPSDVIKKEKTDVSSFLSKLLNLEVKIFNYVYSYFCSKFLLLGKNTWYIVPDPVKLLNKLGRLDVMDFDHLEEYRISTADNFRVQTEECLLILDFAISERYYKTFSVEHYNSNIDLIISLIQVVSTKENFSQLFYEPDNYVKPHSGFIRVDLSKNM